MAAKLTCFTYKAYYAINSNSTNKNLKVFPEAGNQRKSVVIN